MLLQVDSPFRTRSVEENLKLFKEKLGASSQGFFEDFGSRIGSGCRMASMRKARTNVPMSGCHQSVLGNVSRSGRSKVPWGPMWVDRTGSLLLRAKIDMNHPNMNMRDPPMRLACTGCLGTRFPLGS